MRKGNKKDRNCYWKTVFGDRRERGEEERERESEKERKKERRRKRHRENHGER